MKKVTDATNDLNWEEKESANKILRKEDLEFDNFNSKYNNNNYYDAIDKRITPYEIFALNGDNNSTKLCLKYQVGKRVISQFEKMIFRNKIAAVKYFQEMGQTHRILWDEEKQFSFGQLDVLVEAFNPSLKQVS